MQNCSPAISQTPSASEAPLRMDEGTFKMPRNAARELLDNRDDERIQIKRQVCSMEVVTWFTIIISNRLNMSKSLITAFVVVFSRFIREIGMIISLFIALQQSYSTFDLKMVELRKHKERWDVVLKSLIKKQTTEAELLTKMQENEVFWLFTQTIFS